MDIFKSFILRWWEAGIFKVAMISLGILIGITWPELFRPFRLELLALFILSTLVILRIWWKQ